MSNIIGVWAVPAICLELDELLKNNSEEKLNNLIETKQLTGYLENILESGIYCYKFLGISFHDAGDLFEDGLSIDLEFILKKLPEIKSTFKKLTGMDGEFKIVVSDYWF